ncbi:MAG: hypothetical protein ACLRL6_04615 [Clostridium sp.]
MQLKIFHESLPTINEQKYLVYQILDENGTRPGDPEQAFATGILERCGFQLEIHVEEMKIRTDSDGHGKSEAAAKPVKVYEKEKL